MASATEFACVAEARDESGDHAVVTYVAVLRKDDARGYALDFPDFPGYRVMALASVEEAPDAAQETLALLIQDLLESGRTLPVPTRLDDVLDDPDYFGSLAFLQVETICEWAGVSVSS